ncbi:hypothetical protein ACKKBF_B10870 [Auxenochlorella protothecoides x Auxenochlorella symbiontica]
MHLVRLSRQLCVLASLSLLVVCYCSIDYDLHDDARFIVSVAADVPDESTQACEADERSQQMKDNLGNSYLCCYPPVLPVNTSEADAKTPPQVEASAAELLAPLVGWCTVLTEDWWTYEVCYEKEVQQYHAEDGKVLTAYHLGYYQPDDEASVETLTLHGKGTKFLAQQYVNGSDCELARKQRSTEVRYTCGQDDKSIIQSVREVESCSYVVTILTPLLCAHDDFVSVEPPPQEIHCRQLPDSAPSPDAHVDL